VTPRDRRALGIGIAVVLGAIFVLRVVPAAWRSWHASREELEAQRALLVRAERALGGLDSLEASAAATRAKLVALAPMLVSGRTSAEAQADLHGRLALIANRERTRLVRADPVPEEAEEALLRMVRLRVEVESDWNGVVGFLQGVVRDPAVLRVRSVAVRGSDATSVANGPEVLSGEIEVVGWYLARPLTDVEGDR
jgi:type II secretory pathway component PulM